MKGLTQTRLVFRARQWLARNRLVQVPGDPLRANSKSFLNFFPRDVHLIRVATGFRFAEGPVWCAGERRLIFSDIHANRILRWSSDSNVSVFREPSNNANGLTRDREGRLIACEHGARRVTRTERDGSITVLADRFDGNRLNSPNDIVVKSDGSIYFTDPPYGIQPHEQELPFQGVYRIEPDSNTLTLLARDFVHPNGLAFSPDERRLYIADSSLQRRHVRVFDVETNGGLVPCGIFHDMNVSWEGVPDGMKVDTNGHVYCTGPGGVWVFDPQGVHLGTILTPEEPGNCAWGEDDMKSLFITARTSLYRIRVAIPGIPVAVVTANGEEEHSHVL